jgi:hypothetical protein
MTPEVVGFCCPCPALRCGANSQQTTSVDCNDLLDHLVGTAERPRFRGTTVMDMGSVHSALIFAALMIGVQRAISLFTSAASGC